ncbi:MAG: hypothetical protein NC310_04020 [Roseburia sp.]|nr:hypothetical protein [Anaeroplasma bactoclasticum]MCM1196226.1 hypothetical protein [Roseburia sp.]
MKKITKLAACGLLAALGLTAMASCGEENSLAKEVISKVILTQDGEKVSADFTVPKVVKHEGTSYDVSWTSSDTSVLDVVANNDTTYTADVKRPFDADKEIKLKASVSVDGKTASSDFKTTVTAIDAETALSAAISSVGIKASYGEKVELNLPTKSNEYKDEITFEYTLGGTYASTKLENTKLTFDPSLGQETVVVKVKATSGATVVEKEINTRTSLKTVYLSVTEALAQPVDAMIYFQGKIKSIVSDKYGNFWIEDDSGKEIEIYGLYQGTIDVCYDADNVWQKKGNRYDAWNDFEKLAVGDYVYAYGKRAVYQTTQEVSNCLLMGTVKDFPVSTVKEALDTSVGDFVAFSGEVKSIASDKYGNMYLKDGENEIYLYGCYTGKVSELYDTDGKFVSAKGTRYDAMKDKPQVGDVIVVYGPRDEHSGTQQIKNAILLYYVTKTERKSDTPETPVTPAPTGDALAKMEVTNGSLGDFTFITNDAKYPDPTFNSAKTALNLKFENSGVKSSTFAAVNSCEVIINIFGINENTKTGSSTDVFTIKGYNAAGEVVDTKTLTSVAVGDGNKVTLSGTKIVYVEVIMTGYPASTTTEGKFANCAVKGVEIREVK